MFDLDHIFTYHAPTGPEQLAKYQRLRDAAKAFAYAVDNNVPDGDDKAAAIRHIREAVMTANSGIALDGRL
jgi:hypothetical protein